MKVILSNGKIKDIIKYNLHKIMYLNIDNNNLIELPIWISECRNVKKLVCSNNKLKTLPENLPQSLCELWCQNNRLICLPENLPQSLKIISCYNNKLKSLPKNLPKSLELLYCYYNDFTETPETLCQSLERIPKTQPNNIKEIWYKKK